MLVQLGRSVSVKTGDPATRFPDKYFGIEHVVLEHAGNVIWCIFDELVVPDKSIIVRGKDLTRLLVPMMKSCSEDTYSCAAGR